jgi:hypothetical protein
MQNKMIELKIKLKIRIQGVGVFLVLTSIMSMMVKLTSKFSTIEDDVV